MILGEKKESAFNRIKKTADPFLTHGGLSRHLSQLPEKYFFQRLDLHQNDLPEMMFQIILAPKPNFCRARFLICNPPCISGLATFAQLTRVSFFSFCFPPFQRNFLSKASILAIIPFGERRMEHLYIGILEITALIRTTFPLGFNQASPHVLILFLIFF